MTENNFTAIVKLPISTSVNALAAASSAASAVSWINAPLLVSIRKRYVCDSCVAGSMKSWVIMLGELRCSKGNILPARCGAIK